MPTETRQKDALELVAYARTIGIVLPVSRA